MWLVGHSAGAHLASSLLCPTFQQTLSPDQKITLKGMVLISGIYDVSPLIHTSINEPLQLTRYVGRIILLSDKYFVGRYLVPIGRYRYTLRTYLF